jgi:uncharacterized membrane protein YbhN (UPF0104 family)
VAQLDGPAVGAAFSRVEAWWLLPMVLLGCANFWLRAMRWGVLLMPAAPLPIGQLIHVGVTSALAGLGLPGRGGDAVKVFLATRLPGVGLADVAAAELLERLVDGAIFGAFLVGASLLHGFDGWPLTVGLGALGIYLPILLVIPAIGWYLGATAEPGADPRPRFHPIRMAKAATRATRRRGPAVLARAARISALAWSVEAASYYCLLVAFGWLAPPTLPFAAVSVANFAFAIPGAPAGVGTFHLPVNALLVDSFGAEPGLAAAYVVALHVAVLAPVPLLWLALIARRRWIAAPLRIR